MKISIDIDNTLTRYPEFFSVTAIMLQQWGHKVGILTGRTKENVPDGPWDFVIACTVEESKPYTTDEQKAREWKPKMIREHNIDIHYDDYAYEILKGDVGNCKVVQVV